MALTGTLADVRGLAAANVSGALGDVPSSSSRALRGPLEGLPGGSANRPRAPRGPLEGLELLAAANGMCAAGGTERAQNQRAQGK